MSEIHGELGVLAVSPDGEHVQCHICGRWYQALGKHVSMSHGITPDEYRQMFGLNRGTGLCSPALAERIRGWALPHLKRWDGQPPQLYHQPGSFSFEMREENLRRSRKNYRHLETTTVACVRCGATVETKVFHGPRRKYCAECAVVARREKKRVVNRRWRQRQRARLKAEQGTGVR